MDSEKSSMAIVTLCLLLAAASAANNKTRFDENYDVTWGFDHAIINQQNIVQLSMDASSGAGFQSKQSYGSGFFYLRIKLPANDSAGVVTAFYLTSHSKSHDEVDFEFLGDRKGKPYTLQTNVFTNGKGNREQRLHLWFDPTSDFHNYQILWNQHQIVFFVDNVPIRVLKNNASVGVNQSYFPTQPMQIEASLWDGESWATNGGQTKTNWTNAPFLAYFQGFDIDGCSTNDQQIDQCYSSKFWWNLEKYWRLDGVQEKAYENVKYKYINYDYCLDRQRYPTPPPDCY